MNDKKENLSKKKYVYIYIYLCVCVYTHVYMEMLELENEVRILRTTFIVIFFKIEEKVTESTGSEYLYIFTW